MDISVKQNRVTVGIITRSLMIGGAQKHIVKLCQNTNPNQAKIILILLIRDEATDLLNDLPKYIEVFINPYPRHHILTIFWLYKLINEQKVQIIHSFLWTADAYASLVHLFVSKIPLIISERGDRSPPFYNNFFHKLIDRILTFRFFNKICANSSYGKQILVNLKIPDQKIIVIPNGVDVNEIDSKYNVDIRAKLHLPIDSILVGFVGRLEWIKGGDILLHAIHLLNEPNIECIFIGTGPEFGLLQQMARDLNIYKQVYFTGKLRDPIPWIKDIDITVLLTRTSEHCSNSILEYMACQKPVIATKVGGNSELVIDNENGYLVTSEDPYEVANRIHRLIIDTSIAKKYGENSRKRVETYYQIQDIATQFLYLWRETIAESRRTSH